MDLFLSLAVNPKANTTQAVHPSLLLLAPVAVRLVNDELPRHLQQKGYKASPMFVIRHTLLARPAFSNASLHPPIQLQ